MVDTKIVQFTDEVTGPNIARNPLPDHNAPMIGAIFSDLEVNDIIVDEEPLILAARRPVVETTYISIPAPPAYTSEKKIPWNYHLNPSMAALTRSGRVYELEIDKGKAVVEDNPNKKKHSMESEREFDFLVRPSEYDIIEQLKKAPAKISIMSLLQSSETHKRHLMDVLKRAHVPKNIEEYQFKDMIGAIIAPTFITFSDEDLTEDGTDHVHALHISVRCGDMVIPSVLVDNGSAINVIPKNILTMLLYDFTHLETVHTTVCAFDGTSREVEGRVTLPIMVGMKTFDIEF